MEVMVEVSSIPAYVGGMTQDKQREEEVGGGGVVGRFSGKRDKGGFLSGSGKRGVGSEKPEESSEASSLGNLSDDEDDEGDDVVSSSGGGGNDVVSANAGFASLGSLEDSLPIKRGLSNCFSGRSKSFANLSDVNTVADLQKEENPFNKRRRTLIAYKLSRKNSGFYSWQNPNSMPLLTQHMNKNIYVNNCNCEICTENTSTNKMTDANDNKNESWASTVSSEEDVAKILNANLDLGKDASQSETGSQHGDKSKRKVMLEKMKQAKSAASNADVHPSGHQSRTQVPNSHVDPSLSSSAHMPPTYESVVGVVQGSNIGSVQNEPKWTDSDLAQISKAVNTRLNTEVISDTRRNLPDPEKHYLTVDDKGTTIARRAAYLPIISTDDYKLGFGKPKPDQKVGKSRVYSDIVMRGTKANFILNQWTSIDVIMEGVPQNVLDKPARTNASGKLERRIGHDFARIGLPKKSFGPIFETVRENMPAAFEDISITTGYYWLNASWGVTGSPGTFIYKDENGVQNKTHRLYDAMKRIMPSSSYCVATVAISISDEATVQDGRVTASGNKHQFSIKLHNVFHLKKVTYRSPPQASSTGFEITDDIFNQAENLSAPTIASSVFSDTASAFNPGTMNPFALIPAGSSQNPEKPQNFL